MLKININKLVITAIILIFVQIIACDASRKNERSTKDGSAKVTPEDNIAQKEDVKVEKEGKLNMDIINLLRNESFIPEDYPLTKIINEEIVVKSENKILGFYQLNLHESLKFEYEDPMYNLLFLISDDKVSLCEVIPSVYPNDFSYSFIKGDYYFFLDYSSPAGIHRYLIIDFSKNDIFYTAKMLEDEFVNIDTSSFDFNKLQFKLNTDIIKKISQK